MSKMSKAVSKMREVNSLRRDEVVTNFMGGDSYKINPLDTLKMISASSIYGEPSYYRDNVRDGKYTLDKLVKESILPDFYDGKTTTEIFTQAIDDSLNYDFKGTIDWAVELRKNYNMRLNPQVIMVRAAIHKDRDKFTSEYPGGFDNVNQQVMSRPDDVLSQMSYYLFINKGKKNNIPSVIKRSWAKRMNKFTRYNVNKYKNHEIGMINAVRICHAHSDIIDELMKNGTINVENTLMTWEQHKSAGKSWTWILENCEMGHMALLRNLRGVFSDVNDMNLCREYLNKLKSGVKYGKQFPFRYYSAIKAVENSSCNFKSMIIEALEECMDISTDNYPFLKGRTMCLSDNSGSAWGSFNSEYGSVTIAEIDNLSSVITAACSEDGYVGKFGDKLKVFPINKRRGILDQTKKVTEGRSNDVGGSTEGGIWEFFKNAIEKKEHWDNIFIFSDQQAGHGGLYGTHKHMEEYKTLGYNCSHGACFDDIYINVYKLILEYRKKVNPKVNVFSIQTASYNNVLIPEYAYRTNIMYGWTGKEALFASIMINQWNEIDNKN